MFCLCTIIAGADLLPIHIGIGIHTRIRISTSPLASHDGFLADFGRAFNGGGRDNRGQR
jgi:hypothetical protein